MKTESNRTRVLTLASIFAGILLFHASTGQAAGITVQPDGSILIQIVNFVLLIIILNIVLFKPIRKVLSQRKEKVEGFESSINECYTDMEEKTRAYKDAIKSARTKGIAEKDERIAQASAEEQKIIEELNARAQAEMNEVRKKVTRQIDSIRDQLEKEIDSFAEAIGEKILGRAV